MLFILKENLLIAPSSHQELPTVRLDWSISGLLKPAASQVENLNQELWNREGTSAITAQKMMMKSRENDQKSWARKEFLSANLDREIDLGK